MKIDWKRKLSSRKFWAAVAGFVTPMLIAFGISDSTATQVTALIVSGGSLIAYMLAEGITDSSRNSAGDTDSDDSDDIWL